MQLQRKGKRGTKRGFSLLELLVVVGAVAIATAMAAPVLLTARNAYQLRSATVDLASLLQRARVVCVRQNRVIPIRRAANNTQVYLDSYPPSAQGGPNGQYDAAQAEPMILLPSNITAVSNTSAGAPIFPVATLGFSNIQAFPAQFDGRGLPCVFNGAICTNWAGGQVGFLYYLRQDLGNNRIRWTAVSITPGGQVKTWSYNGGGWANN